MRKRKVFWLVIVLGSMVLALLSLIPLRLLSPINFWQNPAPLVVPALREWHGESGSFVLNSQARILLDPPYAKQLQGTAQVFQQDLSLETGITLPVITASHPGLGNFFLTLQTRNSVIGDEGYLLTIGDSVTINARTTNGVFYGTRTVLQILQTTSDLTSLPKGSAVDYPQYQERGFMLDVGRKFIPLGLLEDYVRLMSWYKFNDLQLHFNDNALNVGNQPNWQHQYAAFRLNSPALPGLAAPDGSYTEQQILDLEQFASERAVTITPEIDTPAHDLALTQYRPALANPKYSKEFLNLNDPATYNFVDSLWNTFLPWFTASQVAMGMDEYDSTTDANTFRKYINYYDNFLRQRGKTARMWGSLSEMQGSVKVNNDIVIEDWDNTWSNPVNMVRQGFRIINANDDLLYIVPHANYFHDYLDTQLLYTSWEPYIFDLNDPAMNLQPGDPHVLGGMFAVWNDKLGSVVSDNDITERIKPALPVLGEKMWTGPTPDTSYTQFEQAVQQIGLAPGVHLT